MRVVLENISIGNRKDFKDFFISTHKDMVRYASSFISDIDVIEDIVQDCYIQLWENRNNIDESKSVIGYLKQSIKNNCLNYNRHEKVKDRHHKEVSQDFIYTSDLVDEEIAEKISVILEELPTTVRKVLELNVVHGLKYAEIAEDMGISINTVKYHVKSAYKSLRKSIQSRTELIYFFFLLKKVRK